MLESLSFGGAIETLGKVLFVRGVAQPGERAWFGTRRSEVQILSPRPLIRKRNPLDITDFQADSIKGFFLPFYHLPTICRLFTHFPLFDWVYECRMFPCCWLLVLLYF